MTVGHRRFYAYRDEGKVSDCEKAVVLLCYSEKYFGSPDALRVFISTQTNLSTQEILEMYAKRWSIEVFFRNCKQKLAFDKCQLRKQRGIERMWLLLSLVHFLCCTLPDYRGVLPIFESVCCRRRVRFSAMLKEKLGCFLEFAHS